MTKYLNRWLLAPLGLLAMLITFFVPALVTFNADHLSAIVGTDSAVLDKPFVDGVHQRFVATPNHPGFVVDAVTVDSVDAGSASVSFTLRAFGQPKDYPVLLVQVLDGTTKPKRRVLIAQKDYQHGSAASSERAHLSLPMNPGETGLVVSPATEPLWAWSAALAEWSSASRSAKP